MQAQRVVLTVAVVMGAAATLMCVRQNTLSAEDRVKAAVATEEARKVTKEAIDRASETAAQKAAQQ